AHSRPDSNSAWLLSARSGSWSARGPLKIDGSFAGILTAVLAHVGSRPSYTGAVQLRIWMK
ncbi:TPA: hypothetical protein ACPZRZ_001290, partial [Yersinia enterocolitica]